LCSYTSHRLHDVIQCIFITTPSLVTLYMITLKTAQTVMIISLNNHKLINSTRYIDGICGSFLKPIFKPWIKRNEREKLRFFFFYGTKQIQ
jgi:hypothetical protein